MFISEAFIWHNCNGNRGGFTVCAVKNNLGILYRNALDLNCRFYVVGATLENICTSICMCFQDCYYAGYVVCYVSVYTIFCCLPCRFGI